MGTNNLIDDLSKNLKPVKSIGSPMKRFTKWIIVSSLIILLSAKILLISKYGFQFGRFVNNNDPLFIFENITILISGIISAVVTFRLSIPSPKIKNIDKILISLSTLIWVSLIIYSFLGIGEASLIGEIKTSSVNHHCLSSLNILLGIPAFLMFFMLKKSATTSPRLIGYTAILSLMSFGALAMRYVCILNDPLHLFTWHFAPVLLYALMGTILGKFILKW